VAVLLGYFVEFCESVFVVVSGGEGFVSAVQHCRRVCDRVEGAESAGAESAGGRATWEVSARQSAPSFLQ
jgi:hypothetical protein